MIVLPPESDLDGSVQRVKCHFFRNEQPAPDHRRDSSQAPFELVHFGICNVAAPPAATVVPPSTAGTIETAQQASHAATTPPPSFIVEFMSPAFPNRRLALRYSLE
jgi:hypothetical protein